MTILRFIQRATRGRKDHPDGISRFALERWENEGGQPTTAGENAASVEPVWTSSNGAVAMSRKEKISACRTMAVKELAQAQAAQSRSSRVDHVYNAASWSERADLLQRMDDSFDKREDLDRANKRLRERGPPQLDAVDPGTRPPPLPSR